jgi:hypothetical protein
MAARHGASRVYACEIFDTMAKIAERVCEVNQSYGKRFWSMLLR